MNITRRLAVNAAVIIAATGFAVALSQVVVLDRVTDTAAQRELASLERQFNLEVAQMVNTAVVGASIYAQMPPVVEAFRARDRARLAELTVSGFGELNRAIGAEQLQFHEAPATSFFRAHMPDRFGDDLSSFRQTVLDANSRRMPVGGLERGRGGVGVRGVVPVTDAGRHLGTVEIGLALDAAFVEAFAARNGIQASLFMFADEIAVASGADQGRYVGSTFRGEGWQLSPEIMHRSESGMVSLGRRTLDGVRYAESVAPVIDFAGVPIGALHVAMPVEVYVGLRNEAVAMGLVICLLVLLLGVGVTVWRNRDIGRQIEHLIADVEKSRIAADAQSQHLIEACSGFDGQVHDSLARLGDLAGKLGATAGEMNQSASIANEQSATMASAAEEANVNTAGVAEAMAKMAEMITQSVGRNEQTQQLTEQAQSLGGECRQRVTSMTEAVDQIGAAVSLIENIASQTNLLALNATIEAARAGDAGRGFAVVASEVKSLADQTARTTDEITRHIGAIQGATTAVVEAIERMTGTIEEVNAATVAINRTMDQELHESQEVSERMRQAAIGVAEITRGIEQAAGMANRTADGAKTVATVAGDLEAEGQDLRARVDGFLKNVRVV
ncbi:MAG: hypothetical protein EA356_17820 [Geminicoccaceae bacterium]|nr:MAG: hypothetical protein EA356_17820 [Geminicoccaceae bacterium]